MPRNKQEQKQTVYPNHSFFWDTSLSNARMREINDWLGTLSPDQKKMIEDLLRDEREDGSWSASPDI